MSPKSPQTPETEPPQTTQTTESTIKSPRNCRAQALWNELYYDVSPADQALVREHFLRELQGTELLTANLREKSHRHRLLDLVQEAIPSMPQALYNQHDRDPDHVAHTLAKLIVQWRKEFLAEEQKKARKRSARTEPAGTEQAASSIPVQSKAESDSGRVYGPKFEYATSHGFAVIRAVDSTRRSE